MLLTPEPGLIIWTIITFLVVLVILSKTVWKPLLAALDERPRGNREQVITAVAAEDPVRIYTEYIGSPQAKSGRQRIGITDQPLLCRPLDRRDHRR